MKGLAALRLCRASALPGFSGAAGRTSQRRPTPARGRAVRGDGWPELPAPSRLTLEAKAFAVMGVSGSMARRSSSTSHGHAAARHQLPHHCHKYTARRRNLHRQQRDEEFMFDAVTIRPWSGWSWVRWSGARAVTPLAFLGFFFSACFPPSQHPPPLLDEVRVRAIDHLIRA